MIYYTTNTVLPAGWYTTNAYTTTFTTDSTGGTTTSASGSVPKFQPHFLNAVNFTTSGSVSFYDATATSLSGSLLFAATGSAGMNVVPPFQIPFNKGIVMIGSNYGPEFV